MKREKINLNIGAIAVSAVLLASCSATHQLRSASDQTSLAADNLLVTTALYNEIVAQNEISTMRLFLNKMPKGGDVHHHYSGTIYAETYLDWVQSKNWHIDSCTLRIITGNPAPRAIDTTASGSDTSCRALTVEALLADEERYRQLLAVWSDKDFDNHYHQQPPPDSQFFATFDYFGPIADQYPDLGINIIKQRALAENVSYIETMYSRTGLQADDYLSARVREDYIKALRNTTEQSQLDVVFTEIINDLLGQEGFTEAIGDFVAQIDAIHTGVDSDDFMMRYQVYAVRVQDPLQVFTELFTGHIAALDSSLIVGVNIVAPENHHVALRDYSLHMQMYNYLKRKYPGVNRALHAGELTLGMVRPKDLLFHIEEARTIADAQRIGHGIDLPYERNSLSLLEDLKHNAVIEINLTSNGFILGVEGNAHPYLIYDAYDVPMLISTDDSGVSRNNLTDEFVLLVSRYQPSYEKVKKYVYNSITYSFMTQAEKENHIRLLDAQFATFEAQMAELSRVVLANDDGK